MHFSARTSWDLGENSLAALLRERRRAGADILDLTVSNPSTCGLVPDPEQTLGALTKPGALRYEPEPLGIASARDAVREYYRAHRAEVSADRVCLTASTSEGYSFLFRLLCDPGDEVLIARPSYPLFDFIARLDDVRLVEYPLHYQDGWQIDLHALQAAIGSRTRAVVAVHPNNPTGSLLSAAERGALREICASHGLALIVDEVFLDYPVADAISGAECITSFAREPSTALCFVLSGLSKVCGLPQMKLSWIAIGGPEDQARSATERLEVIADTFLSVNAPAQHALTAWLSGRHALQATIRTRLRENLRTLDTALAGTSASRLAVAAGWTAMLRVPRFAEGAPFAEAALRRGVLVQPGEFYGATPGHVVVSLLTPPEFLAEGLSRLSLR